MVAVNTTDGFTVPSPRRSARLATVEPLSPQKKKPMSPTEKRAHDLRNTPRDDMDLDVDVADKENTATAGTNGSETRVTASDQMDVDLSGHIGLTNFLGIGTQEACEFEFGNISPSDLNAEHLEVLAQMVHVNNQIGISLSVGSSLQSSTPHPTGSPPKTPPSRKKSSPKKNKGKKKAASPVPSNNNSIGFSPLSESHTGEQPMTSTPAAQTGELLEFDFNTLGQSKKALPSDLDALVNELVPMQTAANDTRPIDKEPAPVESNSAPHLPKPIPRKKQVSLFMPRSLSNQVRHNLPGETQTLAQLDREMQTIQLPDAAALALMSVKELQKMKESLKKVTDAQILAFREMRSASGMVAFPGVLDGLMKNIWYMTRFMNHLEDKILEATRYGRQEIEVIQISDGDDEEVSIMPRRRSAAELKDFMRPGLVPVPSHLNPAMKRSASSSSPNHNRNKRAKSQDNSSSTANSYLADLVPQFEPGAQKTVTEMEKERRELATIQEQEIIQESNASTPPPYDDSTKELVDPLARARAAMHRDRRRAAAEAALAADLAEAAMIPPPPVPVPAVPATTLAIASATGPASVPAQSVAPVPPGSQSAPPAAASASQSAQTTAQTPAASQPAPALPTTAQDPAPSQPDDSQQTAPEGGAKKGKGKGKGKETVPEQPPKKLRKNMTAEEKKADDEKKEKERSTKKFYSIPTTAGELLSGAAGHVVTELTSSSMAPALLSGIWDRTKVMDSAEEYKRMIKDSKNTRWDFGPELLVKVKQMIKWSKNDTHRDSFYTRKDLFRLESPTVQVLGVLAGKQYKSCIHKAVRLFQVDAQDPFWKPSVVNFKLVKEGFESKEQDKAHAWTVLGSMMCRMDDSHEFTADSFVSKLLSYGQSRLATLAADSYNQLHKFMVMDEPQPETGNREDDMLDSMANAGKYIIGKIRCLKAGAAETTGSNSRAGNGFLVIQRRIWETLLCILMMQQSSFMEECASMKEGHIREDEVAKLTEDMVANDRGRSIFDKGDILTELTEKQRKEWGKLRLGAFGSMAIYFLYGAAGWWHCLYNNSAYNQKDIWSLVTLAHARHEYLYTDGRYTLRAPECTPWYTTDSFIRFVLRSANVTQDNIFEMDWDIAPRTFNKWVTDENIARFALHDILRECNLPGQSLNLDGNPAPPVTLLEAHEEEVRQITEKVRSAWDPAVARHLISLDEADGTSGSQRPPDTQQSKAPTPPPNAQPSSAANKDNPAPPSSDRSDSPIPHRSKKKTPRQPSTPPSDTHESSVRSVKNREPTPTRYTDDEEEEEEEEEEDEDEDEDGDEEAEERNRRKKESRFVDVVAGED
ncbi:Golgi to ER traffic- protein [Puccinia graminis f. sp. tritici]|uniref:Golgi to ER traffic-protein n=1 Tax=Puccinia graminis f. sp. tritici TaxID=56615 RepID=A0A5B0M0T1_PUCGR|nr:Golgi to ER traffic- protein [Puccinia graminis f. sp. tritici]